MPALGKEKSGLSRLLASREWLISQRFGESDHKIIQYCFGHILTFQNNISFRVDIPQRNMDLHDNSVNKLLNQIYINLCMEKEYHKEFTYTPSLRLK